MKVPMGHVEPGPQGERFAWREIEERVVHHRRTPRAHEIAHRSAADVRHCMPSTNLCIGIANPTPYRTTRCDAR
jgi:hypothetical protein